MAWRAGLGRRAIAAAAGALIVTAVVLTIALAAAADVRAAGRELSGRLVPAAGAAGVLLKDYQDQQTALRDYVTSGQRPQLAAFGATARQIPGLQAHLAALTRGYPRMSAQLAACMAAQRSWLAHVAAPQLRAAARGDFGLARALQASLARTRPYAPAVRARVQTLQAQITGQQDAVTGRLANSQDVLIGALVGMCVLVAGAVVVVRRWLLRPFMALRRAAEDVAAGNYANPIPAQGPAEFAALARSTEHMRTRLVTALAERERAEAGFRRLFESAPDATIAVAQDGTILIANTQAERMFGYEPGELTGEKVEALVPAAARAGHVAHRAGYFADPRPRPMGVGLQLSARRRDGTEFPVEISLNGLPSERGTLVTATVRDISERLALQAERERVRAEAERHRAERRIQQTQKMESLGQLVGGVAHDFNNLLNIITGYTDLSAEQVRALAREDERLKPVLSDIGQVREAAYQAARLTRQLLTFARHDVIKPVVLDLNESVRGAGALLHRTLGERIDLEINTGPGLWLVKADRGQLEQVLVNLAINARDAMARGGKLSIDTQNVDVDDAYSASRPGLVPGRYVRLRVSDTGTGMDQATIDRVFEPFFTTKPKGHGTGLGLATVYGIVTQAGGSIQIYSEPGIGTTVSALLPATSESPPPQPVVPPPAAADQRGHGERILLVEDEEVLRELANRILTRNGYQVFEASSGRHAVQHAADHAQPIDLLLTDVVMPELLGTEVAAQIHRFRPGLPVVYMSGYAQPILDTHGATDPDMNILEKPFTEASLLARIYHALHYRQPARIHPQGQPPALTVSRGPRPAVLRR